MIVPGYWPNSWLPLPPAHKQRTLRQNAYKVETAQRTFHYRQEGLDVPLGIIIGEEDYYL